MLLLSCFTPPSGCLTTCALVYNATMFGKRKLRATSDMDLALTNSDSQPCTLWQSSIFRPKKPKICWLDFRIFLVQNYLWIMARLIPWKTTKACYTKKFIISILKKLIHYYHSSEMAILASDPVRSQILVPRETRGSPESEKGFFRPASAGIIEKNKNKKFCLTWDSNPRHEFQSKCFKFLIRCLYPLGHEITILEKPPLTYLSCLKWNGISGYMYTID